MRVSPKARLMGYPQHRRQLFYSFTVETVKHSLAEYENECCNGKAVKGKIK